MYILRSGRPYETISSTYEVYSFVLQPTIAFYSLGAAELYVLHAHEVCDVTCLDPERRGADG